RGDFLDRKRRSRKRRDRAFRPDRTGALEERISLAACGATERGSTLASGPVDLPSDSLGPLAIPVWCRCPASLRKTAGGTPAPQGREQVKPTMKGRPWIEVRDRSYPTAAGPDERLDV